MNDVFEWTGNMQYPPLQNAFDRNSVWQFTYDCYAGVHEYTMEDYFYGTAAEAITELKKTSKEFWGEDTYYDNNESAWVSDDGNFGARIRVHRIEGISCRRIDGSVKYVSFSL